MERGILPLGMIRQADLASLLGKRLTCSGLQIFSSMMDKRRDVSNVYKQKESSLDSKVSDRRKDKK